MKIGRSRENPMEPKRPSHVNRDQKIEQIPYEHPTFNAHLSLFLKKTFIINPGIFIRFTGKKILISLRKEILSQLKKNSQNSILEKFLEPLFENAGEEELKKYLQISQLLSELNKDPDAQLAFEALIENLYKASQNHLDKKNLAPKIFESIEKIAYVASTKYSSQETSSIKNFLNFICERVYRKSELETYAK